MPINPVRPKKDTADKINEGLNIASTVGSIGSSVKNIMSPKAEAAMDEAMKRRKALMDSNSGGSDSGY